MSRNEQIDYDVIIAGGGNVGAALACAMGMGGLSVAVLEARPLNDQWLPQSVDLRVFAITRASQQLFTALGAWEHMLEFGVSPYREMRVWDSRGDGEIHFDCAELGEPSLGHIIEQRVIQKALLAQLHTLDNVHWQCPAEVVDVQVTPSQVAVTLGNGDMLGARLLVGADGADSRVRGLTGMATRVRDYAQTAIVAVVETQLPHQETARQRFLPTGPLAFLPLRDGRCSIVWSTSPEQAEGLLALDDATFCAQLGEDFGYALGEITAVGERVAFPLARRHAVNYVKERIALVGDAAHSIHPLAGQGVNLGLLDVAALSEVVLQAMARGRDPGGLSTLRRYERWRRGDNEIMLSAMDGFKGLFGSPATPLVRLRNLGLNLVNRSGPVKHQLVRYAMGLDGDLPALSRGCRPDNS